MSSAVPTDTLRAKASEAYAQQTREAAEEERILTHLPLVRHIVQKVASQLRLADVDDLISAGTLGLVQAARSYDVSRDTEFKTYAYIRIRGAVLDELRGRSFVPAAVHQQVRTIEKGYERLMAAKGSPPGDEELAAEVGIPPAQLYRTLQEARRQHFLSIHGLDEDQPALGSCLPPARAPAPHAERER